MSKINYLDILKNAFLITWKNKFLWVFGFLILLGSVGSNLNVNSDNVANHAPNAFANNPSSIAVIGFVLLLIIIALFLLRTMAAAAIVKSANDINLYRQLSVIAILKETKMYLGRLLMLEFLIGGALFVIAAVVFVPVLYLFALKAGLLAYLAMILAIAIVLPLIILAYFLFKYASLYVILTNEKIKMSLEAAYVIFAKNIKESLIMGLVVIATNIMLVIGMIFLLLPVAIVFLPIWLVVYFLFTKAALMIFLTVAIFVYATIACVVVSWHEAFLQTAWLLFFQQIAFEKHAEKKISEKIEVEGEVPSPEVV